MRKFPWFGLPSNVQCKWLVEHAEHADPSQAHEKIPALPERLLAIKAECDGLSVFNDTLE